MINYITSSLEKIGKYGETANKIKDYSSQAEIFSAFGKDVGEKYIGEIAQGLEGLNVDDAVKQLSKLEINPELITEIVRAANDMDLLKGSTQEIEDGLKGLGAQSTSIERLKNVFAGLRAEVFKLLKTPMTWFVAAIAAMSFAAYKSYKAFDDKMEKTNASTSDYESTKSEIDSLNTELETTQGKIEELSNKGPLTITEQEELQKLQQENDELERQIKLKEKLAGEQQAEAEKNALDTLSLTKTKDLTQQNSPGNMGMIGSMNGNYQSTDIVTASQNELKRLKDAKAEREKLVKEYSKTGDDATNTQIENLDKEIESLETGLNDNLSNLSDLRNALADATTTEGKRAYDAITKIIDGYNNIDLSDTERQLNQLNSFFDGSSGKNVIKAKLVEATSSGENLEDTLHKMGLTIDDLGLTGANRIETLNNYFGELSSSAEQAAESIKSVDGSFQGVTTAFESENQDSEWTTMAGNFTQVAELYKNKKYGTDDFKTAVQYITPSVINPDSTKFDSEAYIKAYKEAQGKIKKYFDEENPLDSAINAQNTLIEKGLAKDNGEEIVWTKKFKTSADAAKAFGTSVEAAEAILKNLESYGFEFDSVEFSSKQLESYKTSLEGIENVYNQLDDGNPLKEHLEKNLEGENGWRAVLTEAENDITTLNENAVIKLKFEYDRAELELANQQLEEKNDLGATSDEQRLNNVEIINNNDQIISGLEEENGIDRDKIDSTSKYSEAVEGLAKAKEELAKASEESNGSEEDSKKIRGLQEEVKKYQENLKKLAKDSDAAIEAPFTMDDSQTVHIYGELDTDDLEQQLSDLDNEQTIIFNANVDGVQTQVKAVKDEDGNITYQANIDGVTTYVTPVLHQDGTVTYIADTSNLQNPIEPTDQVVLRKPDDSLTLTPPPSVNQKTKRTPDNSKILTVPTIIQKVKRIFFGGDQLEGTAHVNGTIRSGKAFVNGTLEENKLPNEWKTNKEEKGSLTGELGQELVVYKNNWWTVGDNGAEFTDIPKGAVVFNHKQTKQLFEKGYINSRGSAYLSGTAFSDGGLKLTTGKSSTTSSKKTTTGKKKTTTGKDSGDKDGKTKKSKSWDKFEKWVDKLFDHMEKRLENLSKKTERWATLAENAVTYAGKASNYNKALSATEAEISANNLAAGKYKDQAQAVGLRGAKAIKSIKKPKKWTADILEKLQNGVLTDKNGNINKNAIKKYSEKKQSVITAMNDWLQKSQDATDKVQELTDSFADLYTELENLANNEAAEKVEEIDHQLSLLSTKYDMANSLEARQANLQAQNQKAKETMDAYNKAYSSTSSSLSQAMTSLSKLGISANGTTGIDANDNMTVAQLKAVAKYNAALEANKEALKNAQQAQTDYNKTLYDNAHQMFQNIIDEYEFKRENIAQKSTRINNAMELNETKGYRNSKVYYEGVMANDQEEYNTLQQQLTQAEAELEKNLRTIKDYKGTANYQEEVRGINEIINAMDEMDIKMAQTQNDMNQLDWDNFDKLQEAISRVTDEASFLIDELSRKELIDSDTGTFTDEGRAVMALYAGNYEANRQQVEMYNKEIADWKKYMKDNGLEDNDEARNHLNDLVDAQREYASACQESKYAMIDMAKDGLNAQKDYLQEIIDKYKDLMDKQQSAYEYQKNLNSAVEEINNVQKQIEVYSGDNSEENRARIQQLNKDLKDKQESLQDMQREKLTSDINNMFDDLMDNYGDYIDDLVSKMDDNFDELISTVNMGLGDTQTVIEEFADSLGIDLSEQLRAIQHGNNIEQSTKNSINQIESDQNKLVNDADSRATDDISNIDSEANALDTARDNAVAKGEADRAEQARQQAQQQASQSAEAQRLAEEQARRAADEKAKKDRADYLTALDYIGSHFYKPKSGTKASDIKNATKKKIFEKTKDRTVTVENLNALAGLLGVSSSGLYNRLNELGVFKAIGKSGIIQFAKGSKNIPNDMIAQIGEKGHEIVYRSADGSILTPLGKNDMVFTHEMSENLWQMAKQRNITTVPGVERVDRTAGTVNNMRSGDVIIQLNGNIELPNVYDAKEFTAQLKQIIKSDRNVQGLLMDSTVNKALTNNYNSLSVNKW